MKNIVTKSLIALMAVGLCSFSPKAKKTQEESIQEEVGLNLTKITDDNLCRGQIYPVEKPGNWVSGIRGVSAKQKFYWTAYFKPLVLSPDGNELAYISVKDKVGNIMVRRAAGINSAMQRTFRNVMGISWGTDDKLYFSDHSIINYGKIFSTNSHAGSVMQQMTTAGNDYEPMLSSDGKMLFFTRVETGGPSIWSLNLETGALTSCARGFNPCLIDNERFLCVRNSQTGQSEVWIVDYVNGQETLILSDPERGFTHPVISPDGQWIICEGSSNSTLSKKVNLDIFAVRVDGTQFTQLTYHPAMDCNPIFSKDGKTVYFMSNRSNGKSDLCDIWSMKFPL